MDIPTTGGETFDCTTEETFMTLAEAAVLDAAATLLFFFCDPWSSLDFLFFAVTSAMLELFVNRF